jgi:hypothetical protein
MKAKKIIKKVAKWLGIIILFLILMAIILPIVFKKQIVEAVKTEINKTINAKVDFKDYHLSMFRNFPNLTLGLDDLTVVGVKEFEKDTLANIKKIRVTIGLFSVIKGEQYNIRKISINDSKILLKVLKGGKANWDIAKASADTTKKKEPAQPSTFKLSLNKLEIVNAKIKYDDMDGDMHASIKRLDHELSGDLSADFTSLKTKTTLDTVNFSYGGINYLKKANISIKADIDADLKNSKYTFKENEFMLNNLFLGFDGWVAMPKEDIEMDLKFNTKKTEFKNILSLVPAVYIKSFDKIEAKGKLALDGYAKGVYNDKRIPAFALNLLVENAMFKYPDLPKAVTNINLDVKVSNRDGKTDNTVIDIKKLHLEMGSNPVDIKMLVTTPVSDPNINGTVKIKLNLAEVKQFYPMEATDQLNGTVKADIALKGKLSSIEKKKYEEFEAKGEVGIAAMTYKSKDYPMGIVINEIKMLFSPIFVEMPVCNLKIGKSDINAKGRLDNLLFYIFKSELLKGSFETKSTLLDLNEFMTDSGTKETAPAKGTENPSSMTAIEVPANLDLTLKSSFGRILYDNLDMSNVLGVIKLSNRKLSLETFKMNILGGGLTVNGYYSTQKPEPQVDFNLDISNFDIPQTWKTFITVQKLAPVAEKCSGKFSAKMNLNSLFDSKMNPQYNSMNGGGTLSANNLAVKGFEPLNKIADALKIDKFRNLGIDKVSMNFSFANGKVEVKPYSFTFEKIKTTISGWNSLDQSISYDVVMEIPRELFGGAANGVLNDMVSKANSTGLNIQPGNVIIVAAKIGGTIIKPTISTNIKKSVNDAVNDLKNQVIEEVKDRVNQEVKQVKADVEAKIQKILADAQVAADQIRAQAKAAGDALISEADKQGKALVDQANNPITKAAAKKTAEKLVEEATNKSNQLQQEAEVKANKVLDDARKEAEKLRQ